MKSKKLVRSRPQLKLTRLQTVSLILGLVSLTALGYYYVASHAATNNFRFAAFSDVQSGLGTMKKISPEVMAKNPVFALYPGDTCADGSSTDPVGCFAGWKSAINGGGVNNLFDRLFVTRGNHDAKGATFWANTYDFRAMATRLGATNYAGDDLTFSFDYGNSHFIGVDCPGGNSTTISQSAVDWIERDLAAAEARGVTNSFAFWHGPVHPKGGHCCTDDTRFIALFGRHQTFRAVFSGHEHGMGAVLIDSRWKNTGHPFYQIYVAGGGQSLTGCKAGRVDICDNVFGYSIIDVAGSKVSVTLYQQGKSTPLHTITINDAGSGTPAPTTQPTATPTPTAAAPTPTPAPGSTPTPAPTPIATNTPTATPAEEPLANLPGDIDGNGTVGVADLNRLLVNWGTPNTAADVNGDNKANVYDLSIMLSHWSD